MRWKKICFTVLNTIAFSFDCVQYTIIFIKIAIFQVKLFHLNTTKKKEAIFLITPFNTSLLALLIGMLSGYVPVETKAADNNLALHRPARASAYLEGNASYPARTPQLAVDGEGDFVNN